MSLLDVKHQGFAQRSIQRAVAGERTAHSYIFHGPDGVGKEMMARGLAQLLLCGQPVDQPVDDDQRAAIGVDSLRTGCGSCEDCRAVLADAHPDQHVVYRQLHRDHPDPDVRRRKGLEISVDVLRHFLIDRVHMTPARGRAKVFLLREADRITSQAQNALLKTLEEPPGSTFIMLLTASLDRLLPTTQSRCQIVAFNTLPAAFVRDCLGRIAGDLSGDEAEWYARGADGSVGAALERVGDGLFGLSARLIEALTGASAVAPGELTAQWTGESKKLGEAYRKRDPEITDTEAIRRGFKTVFQLAAQYFADLARVAAGDAPGVINRSIADRLTGAAKRVGAERAAGAIERIVRAERQLDRNANVHLVVETLANDLARIAAPPTPVGAR